MEFGEITQNKDYHAVQGHSRSPMSISMVKPVCDFLLVIISNWRPRAVSKLSHIIVQILDTVRFWALFVGLAATYDDDLRLIGKRVVDFILY